MPRSGCELRDSPGFERYRNNPDRVPAEKLKTEIYIPLK
ncbi:GyrI-like domain-containing protein [Alistipes finegoldii]|nr:GyrI-like domain-containing protein [Alistipes finegoldii]